MGTAEPLNIYIGWDSREPVAADVAASSIVRYTRTPIKFTYLKHRTLRKSGHFQRPWMVNGETGEWSDLLDGRPFSTEFSHTRFLIPQLQSFKGWALFIDLDMIFRYDVAKLFSLKNEKFAIMCVKHNHELNADRLKMDGRIQQKYFRKNWSSFVLWNCGHLGNIRLTKEKVNYMKGRDLHAFSWLKEEEIGSLPYNYNYISGISPVLSDKPYVIHYTEGGPWFPECKDVAYADLWDEEHAWWQEDGAPSYDGKLIDRGLDK